MIKNLHGAGLLLRTFLIVIFTLLIFHSANVLALDSKGINTVSESMSKSYTNKFCNAIGIGMSKESAMKISIMENSKAKYNPSLWLEITLNKKENIDEINKSELVDRITKSIVNKCGIAINMSNQEDIENFKNEFKNLLE